MMQLGTDRGRRLLELLGARAALREFDQACAISFAVEQLRAGAARPEIRDRIRARYRFSERTAYRVLGQALDIFCQTEGRSGKWQGHYGSVS